MVSEALANVEKHAGASHVDIVASLTPSSLVIEVVDDGVGGADASKGSGLRGLADRIDSLGGSLKLESSPERGTRLRAEIPCESS